MSTHMRSREAYLKQWLVLGWLGRYLERVEPLLELGAVIVDVFDLDDDPRHRRQRRRPVVPDGHLEE